MQRRHETLALEIIIYNTNAKDTYTVNEHTFQKANDSLKMFFFYWSYEVF